MLIVFSTLRRSSKSIEHELHVDDEARSSQADLASTLAVTHSRESHRVARKTPFVASEEAGESDGNVVGATSTRTTEGHNTHRSAH